MLLLNKMAEAFKAMRTSSTANMNSDITAYDSRMISCIVITLATRYGKIHGVKIKPISGEAQLETGYGKIHGVKRNPYRVRRTEPFSFHAVYFSVSGC